MIEAAFADMLAAEPSITALVGEGDAARITWLQLDKETGDGSPRFPACTLQIVGGSAPLAFDGPALQRLRLQVDSWGLRYLDALTLRAAIRVFLVSRPSGPLDDGTVLQLVEHIQPLDYWDEQADSYRCSDEFYLHFTPAEAEDVEETSNG